MSGLDTLKTRLGFVGGNRQIDRMNRDKLNSLKKALLYSYQSATAVLADGREFRCLINPDRLKNTYDDKIISIPFEDICLNKEKENETTSEGIEEIGMKPGDVFTWKENGTDWLVFLKRFEETAYFRAEIRRCKYSVTIDDNEYKCYAARPLVNEIDWRHQSDKLWNDIDYTLQMYITKDEITEAFFHRFAVIKVNGQPWEVQSIDSMSSDGIIIIYLKEWYKNTIQEQKEEEEKQNAESAVSDEETVNNDIIDVSLPTIIGPAAVYPYDKKTYIIENATNGRWDIGSQKAKIIDQDESMVKIEIISGRSGNFELKYIRENEEDIIFPIEIKSL